MKISFKAGGLFPPAFFVVAALVGFSFAAEVPRRFIEGLAAEKFASREESQALFLAWALEQKVAPARKIYLLSEKHDDPEVRKRCLEVLRGLSERDYLTEGSGFLGITMNEVQMKLGDDPKGVVLVFITMVLPKSPAEKAGLKEGDGIVSLDGKAFQMNTAVEDFSSRIREKKPTEIVKLKVMRAAGCVDEVKVTLGRHPAPGQSAGGLDLEKADERARQQFFEDWQEAKGLGK